MVISLTTYSIILLTLSAFCTIHFLLLKVYFTLLLLCSSTDCSLNIWSIFHSVLVYFSSYHLDSWLLVIQSISTLILFAFWIQYGLLATLSNTNTMFHADSSGLKFLRILSIVNGFFCFLFLFFRLLSFFVYT